jgi:hypothetical protein
MNQQQRRQWLAIPSHGQALHMLAFERDSLHQPSGPGAAASCRRGFGD